MFLVVGVHLLSFVRREGSVSAQGFFLRPCTCQKTLWGEDDCVAVGLPVSAQKLHLTPVQRVKPMFAMCVRLLSAFILCRQRSCKRMFVFCFPAQTILWDDEFIFLLKYPAYDKSTTYSTLTNDRRNTKNGTEKQIHRKDFWRRRKGV